jgi:hypothetical protein
MLARVDNGGDPLARALEAQPDPRFKSMQLPEETVKDTFPPIPDVKVPAGNACRFCNKELATPGKARMHEGLCGKNPDSRRCKNRHVLEKAAEQEVKEILQPNGEPKLTIAEAYQKGIQILEAEAAMDRNAVHVGENVVITTNSQTSGNTVWFSGSSAPYVSTAPSEEIMSAAEAATEKTRPRMRRCYVCGKENKEGESANPWPCDKFFCGGPADCYHEYNSSLLEKDRIDIPKHSGIDRQGRRYEEMRFALAEAKEREEEQSEFIRLQYGSIEDAERAHLWDDDARRSLRAFRTAQRERSEYEVILGRMNAEGVL